MLNFKIKYGINDTTFDVTNICYNKLCNNNIIKIQSGDLERASIFGDPLHGIVKKIYVTDEYGTTNEFDSNTEIEININTNSVSYITNIYQKIEKKLELIHAKLQIKWGNMLEEYPEQIMAVKYLTGKEKVLEIGGNIGRNSLVIAHILKENNNNNFVSLETSYNISKQLEHNRNINNFTFHVENSALSKRKLIQTDWNTIPSDVLLDGYESVNTITLEELNNKYNIEFDTLVVDCEGALYYILLDMPELLDNIKLIMMENDYTDINHKIYVDKILKQNGFYRDLVMSGGWGPCSLDFYEVWKK